MYNSERASRIVYNVGGYSGSSTTVSNHSACSSKIYVRNIHDATPSLRDSIDAFLFSCISSLASIESEFEIPSPVL